MSGLGNPEVSFLSGIKAFFIKHWGYNDLWRAAEGGHDAAIYLYTILLYRDNGGAAANDTPMGYMRWVTSGGSTTSRWLGNEGCLPLRKKAARALHYSNWAFGVNRCRFRHRCAVISHAQATTVVVAWKKGWLRISLFCSEDCRMRCEMVKFAQSIGIGNE
jgi:hypothetical protein